MSYRILLAGGGSGGHVYPLVAVGKTLKTIASSRGLSLEILVVGDGDFIGKAVMAAQLPFKRIIAGKLRRYASLDNVIDFFKMPAGLIQSLWHIFWFMPNVVFAKGGYASLIPCLVARLYLIPVFIHESDFVPGLANRLIGRIARKAFISFEDSAQYFPKTETLFTGNPVRKDLFGADREAASRFFNLSPVKKTVLFLGGSLGAKAINDVVLNSLVVMTENYQIIHQCGQGQYEEVKKESDKFIEEGGAAYGLRIKENYQLFPFLEEEALSMAYAAADITVSRAGGQIFELACLGKPVIVVPRENSSANHQLYNASEFVKYGAMMIEERNLTRDVLMQRVGFLLEPDNYRIVGEKIKTFARLDADVKIAEELLSQ